MEDQSCVKKCGKKTSNSDVICDNCKEWDVRLPENLRRSDTYGPWSVSDFQSKSERFQEAYLLKYWDVIEADQVQKILLAEKQAAGSTGKEIFSPPASSSSKVSWKRVLESLHKAEQRSALVYQQQQLNMPHLQNPLPMSTSSAAGIEPLYAVGEGVLHPEVLKKFQQRLKECVKRENIQQLTLMALYNVTGAGKTKLGYSLSLGGFDDKFVIVIRLMMPEDLWPVPIIQAASEKLPKSKPAHFFVGAYNIVRLWLLSHILFLKDFLEATKEQEWTLAQQRMAFLRASQNGGKEIIRNIFLSHVTLANNYQQCQLMVKNVMDWACQHVGAVFLDEVVRAQDVLVGHFPHVAAWGDYDMKRIEEEQNYEVDNRKPAHMQKSSSEREEKPSYKRTTDLLYAIIAFAEEMTKICRIPHIAAGTRFSVYKHLLREDKISRERLKWTTFSEFPPVTVQDMCSLMRHYYGITCRDLDRYLSVFCGRPRFFFDTWFAKEKSEYQLQDGELECSLKEAYEASLEIATSIVSEWAERSQHQRYLIMCRLYYFFTMFNGYLPWNEEQDNELVDTGLAFLLPTRKKGQLLISLSEYFINTALRSHFMEKGYCNIVADPEADPIFMFLSSRVNSVSNLALVAEVIVARVLMRCTTSLGQQFTAECKKCQIPSVENSVILTSAQSLPNKKVGKWFCFPFKDQVDAIIMEDRDPGPIAAETDKIAAAMEFYQGGWEMVAQDEEGEERMDYEEGEERIDYEEEEGEEGMDYEEEEGEEDKMDKEAHLYSEEQYEETLAFVSEELTRLAKPCQVCKGVSNRMVTCAECNHCFDHSCAAVIEKWEGAWYCKDCTNSDLSDSCIAVFPATKNGPDWWTYLESIPMSVQVKCLEERIGLEVFTKALKSLHPAHFWSAGTPDSKDLRKKWDEHWHRHPYLFFRYIRVIISFSGFTNQVYTEVKKHNKEKGNYQPILLLSFEDRTYLASLIGKDLTHNLTAGLQTTTPNNKKTTKKSVIEAVRKLVAVEPP